jgi:hypothetical protein
MKRRDGSYQRSYWEALVVALKDIGWIDGQNIRIETRWSDGDAKLMSSQSQELVGLKPDILVAARHPHASDRLFAGYRPGEPRHRQNSGAPGY